VPGEVEDPAASPFTALGQERRYRKGTTMILQGDVASAVHLIIDGWVKIVKTTPMGNEVLLVLLGPGDFLGHFEAFQGGDARYLATVVTLADTRASVIPTSRFMEYLHEHPDTALAHLRRLVARIDYFDRRIMEAALFDTAHRVASLLVLLADRFGETTDEGVVIRTALSQDDLSTMVGASRDSVARALTSLRSRDLVRTGRRMITVVDLDAMRAIADEMF